jgi:hypothetical protein
MFTRYTTRNSSIKPSQKNLMKLRVPYAATLMLATLATLPAALPTPAFAQAKKSAIRADSAVTRHRTANVDGIDIFYREAGPADAPAVLLLHGFPTSSHMFRNLIPALAIMSLRLTIRVSARAARRIARSSATASHVSPT